MDIAAMLESNSLKITRNTKGGYSWEFKIKWQKKKLEDVVKESQKFDLALRKIYLEEKKNGTD